jgi:hypothetical protein
MDNPWRGFWERWRLAGEFLVEVLDIFFNATRTRRRDASALRNPRN